MKILINVTPDYGILKGISEVIPKEIRERMLVKISERIPSGFSEAILAEITEVIPEQSR